MATEHYIYGLPIKGQVSTGVCNCLIGHDHNAIDPSDIASIEFTYGFGEPTAPGWLKRLLTRRIT